MSRRNRKKSHFHDNQFWQSANWNTRTFMMYRDWLRGIALNRVKWIGLPKTCNPRFLEFSLLNEGIACIAKPINKKLPQAFFSTRIALNSPPNIYDDFTKFTSIGNNGWQFESDINHGVVVWNNKERLPILSQIDLFARRMAWFDRVVDSNLRAQMNPTFIKAPQQQANTIVQMTKQIAGGEPYIVGTDGLSSTQIEALNLGVPFISGDIETVKEQLFNQFYTFIGVQNTPKKAERMIEEEVLGYNEPVTLRKLDALEPRREAAEKLNRKFGLNIKVVWNDDVLTKNYQATHDIEKKAEIDDKTNDGNKGVMQNEQSNADK